MPGIFLIGGDFVAARGGAAEWDERLARSRGRVGRTAGQVARPSGANGWPGRAAEWNERLARVNGRVKLTAGGKCTNGDSCGGLRLTGTQKGLIRDQPKLWMRLLMC